ncbi:MAG: rRNA pseudouridine synthase [Sedimentisphaerales bacterium]|nr:rRNA pseudouridine synthase [Sedimentisphaerales bacterium]
MPKERLQKILAAAGIDSRRNCEQLILDGFIRVNGKIVDTLPAFADTETDCITVDGKKLRPKQKVYYLLNKPKGVICTNSDPGGRTKAIDLVDYKGRIFCIGRLDADTIGAIILTNDTAISNQVTHPRHQFTKTYVVCVKGKVTTEAVEKLKKGIWLAEGKTAPMKVKVLKAHHTESIIEIKLHQGLNRQIRRVMAKVGYKVTSLKRTKIGKISLHHLGVGRYRKLTKAEIDYLKKI